MVTEVTAFKAEDGSIHDTRLKAAEHDALKLLMQLKVFNHASATAVLEHANRIVEILRPIAEERSKLFGEGAKQHALNA